MLPKNLVKTKMYFLMLLRVVQLELMLLYLLYLLNHLLNKMMKLVLILKVYAMSIYFSTMKTILYDFKRLTIGNKKTLKSLLLMIPAHHGTYKLVKLKGKILKMNVAKLLFVKAISLTHLF